MAKKKSGKGGQGGSRRPKKAKSAPPRVTKGPTLPSPMPPPGLSGDYRGSCVMCARGTETAIGIKGEAEAGIAFLRVLGLDDETSTTTFWNAAHERDPRIQPGMVPTGIHTWVIKLCEECMAKANAGIKGAGFKVGDPRLGQMLAYDFSEAG